jgi:predicted lipoprotein
MSIEELEKLLKAASNNSAVETACQNVRNQYVQNVVIPTYRMLVENTEQLLNKVTNISAQK